MAENLYSTLGQLPSAKKCLSDDLLKAFLEDLFNRGRSKNTAESYQGYLRPYLRHLSEQNIEVVLATQQDVSNFLATLSDKPRALAVATVALRMFYEFLCRCGVVERNPALAFVPRFVATKPRQVLNLEEINAILNIPTSGCKSNLWKKSFRSIRNKVMLSLLYATGIRPAELCDLKEDDIDWSRCSISVRGKGKRLRTVFYPPQLEALFKDYLKKKRETFGETVWVLVNFRDRKMDRGGIWWVLKKLVKAAGVERNIFPLLFRHTFATHLMWSGADLRTIQSLLGHRELNTTAIYTQLDNGHVKKTYDQCHPLANGEIQTADHG